MTTLGCRRVWILASTLALLAAPPAAADWVDNFNGGLQQSWTFSNLRGDMSGPSGTFTAGSVGNVLVLTDPTMPAAGGAAVAFGYVNESFSHVRVGGTVNPLGENNMNWEVGLVARANPAALQAYVLTVDWRAQNLDLSVVNGSADADQLAGAPIPGLALTDSVYLWLELLGSDIVGRAYDQPGGTLLATVSATDTTFSSGVAGVVVSVASEGGYQGQSLFMPLRGTFDNVSATVPEPATVVLLVAGGLGLAGWSFARRRRRSGAPS